MAAQFSVGPWSEEAHCRGIGDLMYPDADDGAAECVAKRICWGCPVRLECITWAVTNREIYGIWGGLTEEERRLIAVHNRKRERGRGLLHAQNESTSQALRGLGKR